MKYFLLFFVTISYNALFAQYTPGSFHYGAAAIKGFESTNEFGAGIRVEFAYNCYNTFMLEYNRIETIGGDADNKGYNELAFGTNLILFNWYPTTITAGMGYIGNDDSAFNDEENNAALSFKTGRLNHGVQIKVRALHHITRAIHLFGEFNIKSLGNEYHTFLLGASYNFNPRR